ncbi:trehalose-phosphatase [Negadavirga shengliensis]|uniref:Trehalose 6-phosphate phosphatase n=1 Tax=Negadavirga shengliensis TaxID=1389218 RepID=A0ABV9T896_9BACT
MARNLHLPFEAVILDMDGVITKTASVHAKAWQRMFDGFLKQKEGDLFVPFDIEKDYQTYIDGIPRLDGIRRFLESRDINLAEGKPDDGPEEVTVQGLGRRKNDIFLKLLDEEGVHVYEDTLEAIKRWKAKGVRLAVISSSRNCRHILASAGLSNFFDVRIDGEILEKEDLKGKPEPDIFLRAGERLGVAKEKTIIIEDAISGVQAGKKAGVLLVVGKAPHGKGQVLEEAGADIVVENLTELDDKIELGTKGRNPDDLPDALENITGIIKLIGAKEPVLFLDYDGSLTPIVSNPEEAVLSEKAKKIIEGLAGIITVGVISGRDRQDVKSKVGLDNVVYAGSHGFDITGPEGLEEQNRKGQEVLPALDEAESHLKKKLRGIEGVLIERKKYAIAVHYRNVEKERVDDVKKAVLEEVAVQKGLKKGTGKKILELKPDLDWHKGKALMWLMDALKLKEDDYFPVFIGDDVTDEDAHKAVYEKGLGIIVGSHRQKTYATYKLENPDEVIRFLDKLKASIGNRLL